MSYEYVFELPAGEKNSLRGKVLLDDVEGIGFGFRSAKLELDSGQCLPISLTHSKATEAFMYLGDAVSNGPLRGILDTLGLDEEALGKLKLPGQLVLGADRTRLVMRGVADCMSSPCFKELFRNYSSGELAVFPVLREGMKYGLAEAVRESSGMLCDEIVVDAHHVADPTVPDLGRRMELSVFKDKDLSDAEREAVKVAIVGDSVASGTVIIGLIDEIAQRFPNLERVELVAPLSAIFGLVRIAAFSRKDVGLRVHGFETLLRALPPDFYFSPHFKEPEMHISNAAQSAYRNWWGRDKQGTWIADTACAGYGWSEAFFNPGKQLRMIEDELLRRHDMTLLDLIAASRAPNA